MAFLRGQASFSCGRLVKWSEFAQRRGNATWQKFGAGQGLKSAYLDISWSPISLLQRNSMIIYKSTWKVRKDASCRSFSGLFVTIPKSIVSRSLSQLLGLCKSFSPNSRWLTPSTFVGVVPYKRRGLWWVLDTSANQWFGKGREGDSPWFSWRSLLVQDDLNLITKGMDRRW